MLIQTNVGQPTYSASGSTPNIRSGKQGDVILSELHARYYEQTYNKNTFFVANQTAVTTTIGLATTYTGLALINPIGSTVNVVLNKATVNQSVVQTTQPMGFAIATGFSAVTQVTNTTPVTTQTGKVGSGALSTATASVSATLPAAPVYTAFMGGGSTAVADATFNVYDWEGSIVLMPGAYAIWATPTQVSVTTSLWFSYGWEEVPL